MKKLIIILCVFFAITSYSQNKAIQTATISVRGNCEECKERIENAADIKGVKISNWEMKTQVLSVTYDPNKVTLEKIKQAIAKSGHDSEEAKATEKSYDKLPECCKYRDRACEVEKK